MIKACGCKGEKPVQTLGADQAAKALLGAFIVTLNRFHQTFTPKNAVTGS